jgi:hypothetical protein
MLLLQQAMPTVLNVHTMAAMHQKNEEVVAVLLFWQYIACIFMIPVFFSPLFSMRACVFVKNCGLSFDSYVIRYCSVEK